MTSLIQKEQEHIMISHKQVKKLRRADRIPVTLPASMANSHCLMRDVSASGVYLESNTLFDLGDCVDFSVEFECPTGKLILKCKGEVVRVEKQHNKVGVAVKIADSIMESDEGSIYMGSSINILSSNCKAPLYA